MKKAQMPVFIQAVYGAILGVSFYKIDVSSESQLSFLSSVRAYKQLLSSEDTFKFILFGFTLAIAAHDWYSYHKQYSHTNHTTEKFMYYLPQIASLFCMSQMFVAISPIRLQYWFIFGGWYTVFNILNFLMQKRMFQVKRFNIIQWITYLGLCFCGFMFGYNSHHLANYFVLVPAMLIVPAFWILKSRQE